MKNFMGRVEGRVKQIISSLQRYIPGGHWETHMKGLWIFIENKALPDTSPAGTTTTAIYILAVIAATSPPPPAALLFLLRPNEIFFWHSKQRRHYFFFLFFFSSTPIVLEVAASLLSDPVGLQSIAVPLPLDESSPGNQNLRGLLFVVLQLELEETCSFRKAEYKEFEYKK